MLDIKKLQVSIDGKTIVNSINLTIKPGEVHAIMGPNGSGKSTLAYALAGHPHYQIDSSSKVLLDKQDLLSLPPDERAKAGLFLAFQYPIAVSGVSVQQFLKAAADAHGIKYASVLSFRKELEQEAAKLGIKPELLKRSLNDGFSGGEKKRVEVLQMHVLKPQYAILDETDSGLDIDSIKLAAQGIRRCVHDFKTACLVITHYQRILNYLKPDVVHVMKDGRIITSGGPELVKKLEKSGYKNVQ